MGWEPERGGEGGGGLSADQLAALDDVQVRGVRGVPAAADLGKIIVAGGRGYVAESVDVPATPATATWTAVAAGDNIDAASHFRGVYSDASTAPDAGASVGDLIWVTSSHSWYQLAEVHPGGMTIRFWRPVGNPVTTIGAVRDEAEATRRATGNDNYAEWGGTLRRSSAWTAAVEGTSHFVWRALSGPDAAGWAVAGNPDLFPPEKMGTLTIRPYFTRLAAGTPNPPDPSGAAFGGTPQVITSATLTSRAIPGLAQHTWHRDLDDASGDDALWISYVLALDADGDPVAFAGPASPFPESSGGFATTLDGTLASLNIVSAQQFYRTGITFNADSDWLFIQIENRNGHWFQVRTEDLTGLAAVAGALNSGTTAPDGTTPPVVVETLSAGNRNALPLTDWRTASGRANSIWLGRSAAGELLIATSDGSNVDIAELSVRSLTEGGGGGGGDLTGAVRYDIDQSLETTEQTRAQRNIGGPFAANTPPGGQAGGEDGSATEAANARWASDRRILFVTGSNVAASLENEVPGSGARLEINTLGGGALGLPLLLDDPTFGGRVLAAGGGTARSLVIDFSEDPPDRIALAMRLNFLDDGSSAQVEQIICDGLFDVRRVGRAMFFHGDSGSAVGLAQTPPGQTMTLYLLAVRQADNSWVQTASMPLLTNDNPLDSRAQPLTVEAKVSIGTQLHADTLPPARENPNMFVSDIVAWVDGGSTNTQTAADRMAVHAAANRAAPYGVLTRIETDFSDDGVPHGSAYAMTSEADVANAARSAIFDIEPIDISGQIADRIRIGIDNIDPASIEASDLALEYRLGSTDYLAGAFPGDGETLSLRHAMVESEGANAGHLRVRLRNNSASTLSSYRLTALGFDRLHPDELEIFDAIPDTVSLFNGARYAFAGGRVIPVEDIRMVQIWGKPGQGSTYTELVDPADNMRVELFAFDTTNDVRGHVWIAGWTANDQSSGIYDFETSQRPGTAYSLFGWRRASNLPAGFVSHIEVVAVGSSQRNLRQIRFWLRR